MLRYVVGLHFRGGRNNIDVWIDYLRKSSAKVDELAAKYGLES